MTTSSTRTYPLEIEGQLQLELSRGLWLVKWVVAGGRDSDGYTDRVLGLFERAGITPTTRTDPYPDLGLQAVRDGLGVVVYLRSAFPDELAGSTFLPLLPPVDLPFHLAVPRTASSAAQAVVGVAKALGSAADLAFRVDC